jgi:hypothetical protein
LKTSKRAAHLAGPVSLCMAMEDDKRGCKKKERRDAAEIRQKATPFLEERYHRPAQTRMRARCRFINTQIRHATCAGNS